MMTSITDTVNHARLSFNNGVSKPLHFRRLQLLNLLDMYEDNKMAFERAMYKDLRRCSEESDLTEIEFLIRELKCTINEFERWAKPEKPQENNLLQLMSRMQIKKEPYGVVLIMGSWKNPMKLCMLPLAGAIAAGNCVVVKPSEVATCTAELLADLFPKYLDRDCYHIVQGGIRESSILLGEKFDYIFYAGSPSSGRVVMTAASRHLTPTILALGGKNPVYLDETSNLEMATRRILWGKFLNAGQTCTAPDYLLCSKQVQSAFISYAQDILKEFYGTNPKNSPHFSRIISDLHFQRLKKLLEGMEIAIGGSCSLDEKYIEPTIAVNVNPSDPIMAEEILGPILPIIQVDSLEKAVKIIQSKGKPLAVYIFSSQKSVIRNLVNNTSSGGVCINDTLLHQLDDGLPFGGIGESGMGLCFGKNSFDSFTHKRSILVRNYGSFLERLTAGRYPPYKSAKLKMIRMLLRKRSTLQMWKRVPITLGCLISLSILGYYIYNNFDEIAKDVIDFFEPNNSFDIGISYAERFLENREPVSNGVFEKMVHKGYSLFGY